jgi:glutaredoxin
MKFLKAALLLVLFAAVGVGLGLGVQRWRQQQSAPSIATIDRHTPGLPADKVVLISLSSCPACAQARNWLQQRGQAFEELAVDQSDDARALADRLDISSVPVLIVGDRAATGFNADQFSQLLPDAGLAR